MQWPHPIVTRRKAFPKKLTLLTHAACLRNGRKKTRLRYCSVERKGFLCRIQQWNANGNRCLNSALDILERTNSTPGGPLLEKKYQANGLSNLNQNLKWKDMIIIALVLRWYSWDATNKLVQTNHVLGSSHLRISHTHEKILNAYLRL